MNKLFSYNDFFPTEPARNKIDYALQIGKDMLYKMACHFLSYTRLDPDRSIDDLFAEWFTFSSEHTYDKSPSYHAINDRYQTLKRIHPEYHYELLNVESFLRLFAWTDGMNIPEEGTNTDPSVLMAMFELLLLFNDEVLVGYDHAVVSTRQPEDDLKRFRWMLATMFPQHDLVNPDYGQLFYAQIYKSMAALEFLKRNGKYHGIYQAFLTFFESKTKEEFVGRLYSAVFPILKNKTKGWSTLQLNDKDTFESDERFLDRLALQAGVNTTMDENDFVRLRGAPVQKVKAGVYRVIFDLFLLKKVFNGMVFKLSELAAADKSLFPLNFLGEFRREFSEGVLLYDLMKTAFPASRNVHIDGDTFKNRGLEREPDYYLRANNDILLMESKDFYMLGASKLSYDFDTITSELKFGKASGSTKADRLLKACIQLKTNVERVLLNQLPGDTIPDPSQAIIFPVIVVHDALYSSPSLNFWVQQWFSDELQSMKNDARFKNVNWSNIGPVTLLEIDTLIVMHDLLASGKVDLVGLLRDYHHYVDHFDPKGKFDRIITSFSDFAENELKNRGIVVSSQLVIDRLRSFGVKET